MDKTNKIKVAVAALSLSAAALIALVTHEGYTDKAVIPTKGDVPTVGFGSTRHEDGSRVQMGDTTTPVGALQKLHAHVSKEEAIFRASLPGVKLTQAEYDLYIDWVYQYGTPAWQRSSMRRELLAGNHRAACGALLDYRFMTDSKPHGPGWEVSRRDGSGKPTRWKFDCSRPGNRTCMGVWTRQQERHRKCLEAQP